MTEQTMNTFPNSSPSAKYVEIHSLAANAACVEISNYIQRFDPLILRTLQETALYSFLAPLDFSSDPIPILLSLRKTPLFNMHICNEWDTIKCFIRLMSTQGIPKEIERIEDYLIETIVFHFDLFKIVRTIYDYPDFDDSLTQFSLNITYPRLRLLLSGDIESNPGPVHSKMESQTEIDRKKISNMQKEILKLKKIQEKQNNFLQRQIELEKRDRKLKRTQQGRRRVAQGLADFTNNLGTTAEALAEGVGPTLDMVGKALQALLEAGNNLKEIFHVPKEYDLVGIVICLISICKAMLSKQYFMVSLHAVQLARSLKMSVDSLMSLVPSFTSDEVHFGNPDEEPVRVGQALVDDMFQTARSNPQLLPVAGFLSFVTGVFSMVCAGKCPSPLEMSKQFAIIGRAAQGFKAVRDIFTWIADYISEIYYTTVYGMSAEEYRFMSNFPQLENIYAASMIIQKLPKSVIDASAQVANQILTIDRQLSEYLYQAGRSNSRPNVTLINNLQRQLKEAVEWASHSPARCHTVRVQPIALYLYGHPGVGKSVLTDVIKARIYQRYLKDTGLKYESCSFPRRSTNEFWEGYTGQPIVILDDFGNVKDSEARPVEEYEEFENMVNTSQYPLKMAELKSKGVCNFTSEFIIASSNQYYPEIKHLTDPGAVFRRFHIWADVTINPNYGTAIGRDGNGKPYFSFDKEAAAKTKGIPVDDLEPLMMEHYVFNLYKVSHNKQTGNAEVNALSGKQNLNFEQYWQYVVSENDRRKKEGSKLADAIRHMAGIETPEVPKNEQQIMEDFDKIFHPEKFISAIADSGFEPEEEEFHDADEDPIFGSLIGYTLLKERLIRYRDQFNTYKEECRTRFVSMFAKLKQVVSIASNKLISVAQFLLSFFQTAAGRCMTYFPSIPFSQILRTLTAVVVAISGVWCAEMFRDKVAAYRSCEFSKNPSEASTPCFKCKICTVLDFPSSGDMLDHFLERSGIKSVREDLYRHGYSRDSLETIREHIRTRPRRQYSDKRGTCRLEIFAKTNPKIETPEEAQRIIESICWFDCRRCNQFSTIHVDHNDDAECVRFAREVLSVAVAERVYEHGPKVAVPTAYAQRVYENQPRVARPTPFAQAGLVSCVTEMHIGARRHAQGDRVQIEQTTRVLLNNSVWIQAVDKTGMACRSNGVFLIGRTMITTAHTILNPPHIDPIEYLVIRNPYSTEASIKVPFSECKVSQVCQSDGSVVDLALVSFPPVVPNRPKILSKFLNASDIDLLREGDLVFSGFYEVNNKTIVQEKYPRTFGVSTKPTEYNLHPAYACPKDTSRCVCPIKIGNHIDYDLETSSGMCGALLSITNPLIHTKLVGFHVAGGAGALALGVLTTQQLLSSALKTHIDKFGIPPSYLIDGRLPYSQSWVDPSYKVSLVDVGDCLSVGVAQSPAAPCVTQLRPSLVFDKIQLHTTKPAHLRPVMIDGGRVDPMEKGIKKIMGGQTWIDPDLLEAAASDVFQGLGLRQTKKGIVHSYEEAIRGVEGDSYKRPINRTTSPGYPYNLNNKTKGKTAWLGDGDVYVVDNPELRRDVDKLIEDSRAGVRGSAISIATLKDEKRPIEKVDAGKTRVFEACPQHLVIAMRQYFLDFSAHIMRNRIDNGIAVGINPYSLEWTKLAFRLQSRGNYMIAGDFSNFDGSLLMQVLVKICEKINDWYGDDEESQMIRSALWEHICNADILVRGEVIRKTHSQPSGNPLTVIINSLFNGIVMRVAYLLLKRQNGLPVVCDYRKYVSEIIYGDDDIKSVDVSVIGWFNQLTITDALASFGLTYTDETKTGEMVPYKSLHEVAFLKRKFVRQLDGTFLAPMELKNILEITNWIRGKSVKISTEENCEQAIMELALHNEPTYSYWTKRIQDELHAVGIPFSASTYWEQMELYRYNRDLYSREEYVPLW